MTKQKGFTLIELLVVIVIIGILATLATVTLSSARQKARDARRVSDVKQMQTALELYYNDAGAYPTPNSLVTNGSPIAYGTTTYMAKVPANATPVDLTASCLSTMTTYPYYYDTATSYHIVYCLGGATGSITAGSHAASPAGIQDP